MTLDEILAEWTKDSHLDEHDLDRESLRISELQNKYLKMLLNERRVLKTLRIEVDRFTGELKSYLRGEFNNPEDLKRLNREPFPLRVLDKNMEGYMNQDKEFIGLKMKVIKQEEKVDALDEIMKSIEKRGYQIKEAVEFIKLKSGY